MSIYQRCLSKSLIFFSIIFIIFLLFLESNIGFKWIFNFANRFFIGLKAEDISGNWRDFTLKNIKYNIFGISIKAKSVHVILDTRCLFQTSTIFKEIETKNVIVLLKNKHKVSQFSKNNTFSNFSIKNIFIKYPIIFQNIHADKISFESPKVHIFFYNFLSGIKLINNNIIFSPTHVGDVHLSLSKTHFKKKNILNELDLKKRFNSAEKIYGILHFFSNRKQTLVPFNINLISLKCNRIKLLDYTNNNLFQIELKAEIRNSVLQIKRIKIGSSFLKIKSYGKIFFNDDYSISFFMKNSIVIPKFHNRIINFSFKANLNSHNKFIFTLKSKDLYKIKFHAAVLLNSMSYPFFIKLQSQNLYWTIKKDYILEINSFNGILQGNINNYFLSLKNIFTLQGLPSIFVNLEAEGNLKNIFLKTIRFFPIHKKKICKKIINPKDNIKYNQDILKLIGKMNIAGEFHDNIHNISVSKINLDGDVMRKKLSILGSIYYKNFDTIESPGINFFLGKNKLYLKGLLGKKYNIHSSIYANNLDYFLPDLKGVMKAKINFTGDNIHPIMTSKILARNLKWYNIYLKSIKILTKMNNIPSGKILIDLKKIHFYNIYINNLHIQAHFNSNKHNFALLLKSHRLYVNLIINGVFNKKTRNWHGFFKRINIKTMWGQVTAKKNNLIDYHDDFNNISDYFEKNIEIKDVFSSFLYNTKTSFSNTLNSSIISFRSELSINAKLKWTLGRKISDGKIFFIGNNTILEKNINEKDFIENIDYFKISINLIKSDFESKWIVKKLKNKSIIGYLNIIDIYNKKNLEGQFNIYNFPFSFVNFFTTNFKKVNGVFKSQIKFFGTLYQPKVSADVSFENIFVRSDNILKYITLFFPYFAGKLDNIKINQEIIMKQGNVVFTLNSAFNNSTNMEWTLLFNSTKISVLILPKIKIKFSSQLNLHYLLAKYDLVGYIKFSFFYFKINEKNFIF